MNSSKIMRMVITEMAEDSYQFKEIKTCSTRIFNQRFPSFKHSSFPKAEVMAAFKTFTVLFLFASAISMSYGQEEMKSVIFKRVHCEASERYIHNVTCYAKSTSSVSKLSIHGFSKKPLESFYVSSGGRS